MEKQQQLPKPLCLRTETKQEPDACSVQFVVLIIIGFSPTFISNVSFTAILFLRAILMIRNIMPIIPIIKLGELVCYL